MLHVQKTVMYGLGYPLKGRIGQVHWSGIALVFKDKRFWMDPKRHGKLKKYVQ